ncbi:MAG TPA: tetratricopeptide repeat protein [Bacteroidota bacterium]|nr:tetratricopeptide repeat protein [Bacteroidota bacterium]
MTNSAKLVVALCWMLVALHIWGAINPLHANWGFHFYGFYPPVVGCLALLIMVLASIPSTQKIASEKIENLIQNSARFPQLVNFSLAAGLLAIGIWLVPAKLHLLGDGAILLRSVILGINGPEITQSFRNQPLMFWIYRNALSMHSFSSSPDPYTVYAVIDCFAAALFLVFLFWVSRFINRSRFETVLLGCLLFLGAGSQFFFGYVENYALQYIFTIGYAVTGWLALERRVSLLIPICCLIAMILLHLGSTIFLPSLGLLIIFYYREGRIRAVLFLTGIALIGIFVLLAAGFNIQDFTRHVQSGSVDFLRPFSAVGGNFPYAMFSWNHLVDWFNSLTLLAPAGLIVTVIGIFAIRGESKWKDGALVFLIVTAACGLFFTWVVNSALGLARDWDLYAGFFSPLLVLPVYLLSRDHVEVHPRKYVLVFLVVFCFLHWAAWIGVNASAQKHLTRMKLLDSPNYLGLTAQMVYDEALANYYFDNGRYSDARDYYRHFMSIDSSNTRIVGNVADVYRLLGDREDYFRMLLRAVALGTQEPGVYSNLGVEYAQRGDTAKAIELNLRAVELNPTMQKALANLGILYATQKKYPEAAKYFKAAISVGMADPNLYRYTGDMDVFLHRYKEALRYYDVYLSAIPTDDHVRLIRDKIQSALADLKKK